MSMRDTDTRNVTLVDLPLIVRLTDRATVLDSELGFTRDVFGPSDTILSGLLPQQRGLHTLVARSDKEQVVGQFRLRTHSDYAQIVYVAPALSDGREDTAWLHVFDAMAREAGKHEAHALVAEVNEDNSLFETMRTAGFAVYARQQIWHRMPGMYPIVEPGCRLYEAHEMDAHNIQSLISHTVPPLVQHIIAPSGEPHGLIYRKNRRVEAFITVTEGKQGIYLQPFMHADVMGEADAILDSLIRCLHKSAKLPVYVCVRRYQEWLSSALADLGFSAGPRQAVMVKHITAGVRHTSFEPVRRGLKAVTGPLKPPMNSLHYYEDY
jgi:hypothetical protein